MLDVLAMIIPWVVTTAAIFALLHLDEERLPRDQLARAWPPASKLSAVIGFSFLCLPIHFVRTRRSAVGFLLGVGATAVIMGIDLGTAYLVELVAGWVS